MAKHPATQIVVAILAFIGAVFVVGGALPSQRYELDHGGYIALVQTSWWSLSQKRYRIRLQDFEDWKKGRPYRQPVDYGEWDWFIEGGNGEWYPMDFIGPPDIAP